MQRGRPLGRVFSEQREGESLDQFSLRCIAPTTGEVRKLNSEIDEFVRFLQQQFSREPHTVSKVIKAGSLGKGTAVRDSADIDLVVYLNNVKDIYQLKELREPVLDALQKEIGNYSPWRGRLQQKKRTQFSVSYYLDGNEIDILPAFALDHTNDSRNKELMYQHMHKVAEKEGMGFTAQQFSASLAPLQIQFVKHQDESVKKVIRLLKRWKQEQKMSGLISYLLELLTIYASRNSGGRQLGTDELFLKVLEMLSTLPSQGAMYFNENYSIWPATAGAKFVHRAPHMLDVANPYNDMLHGVDKEGIARVASATLKNIKA